ncbi:hypothetical protein PSEUDO8AS_90141 [Pseudomonas sp. 8AS]|uniref:hypothetical protein n=1 Tax=Pseudomonas sp. 8AS TaxID=2653163 RepID=UPI0012F0841E|nr:hypothetical protein [Pseudomonas sp. 8AS]VXC51174.1 hypothetical protein PSEUDO8AS_90141 [Pseudomonas sp. 8AS]
MDIQALENPLQPAPEVTCGKVTVEASPHFGMAPRIWASSAVVALALAVVPSLVYAKDAVRVTVEGVDGGTVVQNGAFQTPGTFAVGTVKIDYPIIGMQFPADETIKQFQLCLDTIEGKSKPATAYPAVVDLTQVGTPDVNLALSQSSLQFSGSGSLACTNVTVSVPGLVANDPDFQEDGTELVANLQLATGPRIHLDTVTTVKIHLTLVHPSEIACIRPLHMVANSGLDSSLSDTGITLSVNTKTFLNTSHQGQHVVALVNTCADARTVGLDTTINANFELQSAAAVQTTTKNQQPVDIPQLLDAIAPDDFGNPSSNMCLPSIGIPGMQMFVVKQHIKMKNSAAYPGALGSMTDWYYGDFTYASLAPNTCATPSPSPDVDPSTGEVSIPINGVTYSGPTPPDDETAP